MALLLASQLAYCQGEEANSGFSLPPLPALIDSAYQNAPAIDRLERQQALDQTELDLQRLNWGKFISLQGTATYGNLSSLWNTETAAGDINQQLNTSEDLRYSIGAVMRVPLDQVFSLKKAQERATILLEQTHDDQAQMRLEIARTVTSQCHHVKYGQRRLQIASSGKESAALYLGMAEKQFVEGAIKIGELSHVTDSHNKVLREYEEAKTALLDAYMQLELTVGISLHTRP